MRRGEFLKAMGAGLALPWLGRKAEAPLPEAEEVEDQIPVTDDDDELDWWDDDPDLQDETEWTLPDPEADA